MFRPGVNGRTACPGNKGNAAASVVVNNVDPVLFAQAMRALTELARIKGPAH